MRVRANEGYQTYSTQPELASWQSIVIGGDWLGKLANKKDENNGAVVYVGSSLTVHNPEGGGGGTLGNSGWGCTAGTLEPLTHIRASSAEFCYPILE